MDAVRLVFRGELRRRWRSWVALALLITLVGGLVLAATAAGRRTATAFPRFVAAHGYDAIVPTTSPTPGLAKLPEVLSATEVLNPYNGQPTCHCTHVINSNSLYVFEAPPRALPRVANLVAGRMPDQSAPDQALVSFAMEQAYGVHVGTVIRIPFYSASQLSSNNTNGAPTGPTVNFRVVGIEAAEFEFNSGSGPSYSLYTTQAFARTVIPKTAADEEYFVRLRHGAADLDRLKTDANALGVQGNTQTLDTPAALVAGSIHPQAIGWWVLALVAAFAGLAVIGQALSRQSIVESEDYPTLAALGVESRQLVVLGMARTSVVGIAGAVGALALAYALSPLAPVGEVRFAETSASFAFDGVVLGIGAFAVVVVVLILGLWPAWRAARVQGGEDQSQQLHTSAIVGRLAASGAPPSAVVGVRHALERGRGRASVPVATAFLGTVLAVTALCATAVFGSSLSNLTITPALYGDAWQIAVLGGPQQHKTLAHDKAIAQVTLAEVAPITIHHVSVQAVAVASIRGPILLSTVNGQFPSGPRQIALGALTMHQVGAHVGSVVAVTVKLPNGATRTVPLQVVATVAFPTGIGSGEVGLGTGAAWTLDGYRNAVCPGADQARCFRSLQQDANIAALARAVPGTRGRAAIAHLLRADQQTGTAVPNVPTALVNFGQAVNFPLILGVMLAVFGAATLAHLLVVSVGRRRHEVGLLKALGFVNSQIGAAVCWQATTVALVGIVIGVPLGIVVGEAVWKAFATNVGVVPVSIVDFWIIAALIASSLVVANLLAVVPALAATRSKPGQLLRSQ